MNFFSTSVVFKKTPDSYPEVIAFLLDCPAHFGQVLSYMHVGQHSDASLAYMKECTKATPDEYADLKKELEHIGYKITMIYN